MNRSDVANRLHFYSRLRDACAAVSAPSTMVAALLLTPFLAFAAGGWTPVHLDLATLVAAGVVFVFGRLASSFCDLLESTLSLRWTEFYAGSKWKTPAGEIVSVVECNHRGLEFTVEHEDENLDLLPITCMTAIDVPGMDDRQGMRRDGREIDPANPATQYLTFALCAVLDLIGFFHFNPDGLSLPECLAMAMFVAAQAAYLGERFKWSEDRFRELVAKARRFSVGASTEWRTEDGRVGIVRNVRCEGSYGDDASETFLTLKLSDGSIAEYAGHDIVAVTPQSFSVSQAAGVTVIRALNARRA
jgi:hypothetical protein